MTDSAAERSHEDRVLPAVVYGLYLLSVPSVWVAVLLGLVLAYANREHAGPRMASHYQFLIQTFWKSIWWVVIGVVAGIVGIVLSLAVVLAPLGIPLMIFGWGAVALITVWFYIRLAVGGIYLLQDQPHPRPDAWLF